MTAFSPQVFGPIWGVSEMCLSLFKRAKGGATSKDRHSLAIIWTVNLVSVFLGVEAAYRLSQCRLPAGDFLAGVGLFFFVSGFVLRWYAIIHLGRFFTVNVAIHSGHRVVDTGPYRFLRHPSYTGALLMVFGFVCSFDNWASMLIVLGGCLSVMLYRIHIEESALLEGLGEPYRLYCQRTKRLIPFVY